MIHYIPVGTSEPQDFALRDDDGEVIPGDGLTVTLQIVKKVGITTVAVDTPPTASWLDASAGTVRVDGTEVLTAGVYLVRFSLTASGLVGYCPNGENSDQWHVVPVANW